MERQNRSAATLRNIENAALDLFSRNGYSGTSIDEITAAAHITKGALYYFFKNKHELFIRVCEMAMDSYQKEVFSKCVPTDPSISGIRSLIVKSHKFDIEHPQYSRLYLRMVGDDCEEIKGLVPNFIEYYKNYRELVENLIRGDIKNKTIKPNDVDSTTKLLMAVIDGMTMQTLAYSSYTDDEIDIESIADIILRGLRCSS